MLCCAGLVCRRQGSVPVLLGDTAKPPTRARTGESTAGMLQQPQSNTATLCCTYLAVQLVYWCNVQTPPLCVNRISAEAHLVTAVSQHQPALQLDMQPLQIKAVPSVFLLSGARQSRQQLAHQHAPCKAATQRLPLMGAGSCLPCAACACACSPKGHYCDGGVYVSGSTNQPILRACPSNMTTLGLRSQSLRACGE